MSLELLNSFVAVICFLSGGMSFLTGFLLLYDDRGLNKWLSSFLLMLAGISIISAGFEALGFGNFKYLRLGVLFFQTIVGFVAAILVRQYLTRRDIEKTKRELAKIEEKLRKAKEEEDE